MTSVSHDILALRAALPALSGRDADFAASLLNAYDTRGLSDKQKYWVGKLAQPQAPAPTASVGDFSGVVALFDTAKASLKFPKVRLSFDGGKPLVLSMAGAKAKCPGTINVTDGGSFGSNVWYGRVDTDGSFTANRSVDAVSMTAMTTVLAAFARNPAKVGAAYGQKFGVCCFCARTLTDDRSIKVGYGPVCADKWALPWGA